MELLRVFSSAEYRDALLTNWPTGTPRVNVPQADAEEFLKCYFKLSETELSVAYGSDKKSAGTTMFEPRVGAALKMAYGDK